MHLQQWMSSFKKSLGRKGSLYPLHSCECLTHAPERPGLFVLLLSGLAAEKYQLLVMQQKVEKRLDIGCSPWHLQSTGHFNDDV